MSEAEDIAAAKRALLFEKIGHVNDETGVDMARVDRFLSSLGLTAAPHHLIINGRDEETVIKEMRAVGIKAASLKGLCGRYYSQLDLPLVRRDNLFEAQTETILFHEKVHSSRGGASAN
jgi:hypothetical protein